MISRTEKCASLSGRSKICDAIKQNDSEVENVCFLFFGIFYLGVTEALIW